MAEDNPRHAVAPPITPSPSRPFATSGARFGFITRLQRLKEHLFREELQELDRKEIETFIRRQLPEGQTSALTAEAITSIADFSGGDPVRVKRLSRLLLEFPDVVASDGEEKPVGSADRATGPPHATGIHNHPRTSDTGVFRTAPDGKPEIAPPRRRQWVWGLAVGILLCLVIGGFLMVAGEPELGAGTEPLPQVIGTTPRAAEEALASAPSEAPPQAEAAWSPIAEPAEEAPSAEIPEPNTAAPAAPAPTPTTPVAEPPLSALELAALVARGDAFVSSRDIATARLFY